MMIVRKLFLIAATTAVTILAMTTSASIVAHGQTPNDPELAPIPTYQPSEFAQSIVILVQFNSPTDIELLSMEVSNAVPPARIGGPPLIGIETMDDLGSVLDQYQEWHPLWAAVHGDDGAGEHDHSLAIEESGVLRIVVPFLPEAKTVAVNDIQLGQQLGEFNVEPVIVDYCAANPDDPQCATVPAPTPTPGPTCATDVDGDGEVTLHDVFLVANALGSKPGRPRWNPDADVNGDGRVDLRDLLLVAHDWFTQECG